MADQHRQDNGGVIKRPQNPEEGTTYEFNGITYKARKDNNITVWDAVGSSSAVTRSEFEILKAKIEGWGTGGPDGGVSTKRYVVMDNAEYQTACETAALEVYDILEDKVVPKIIYHNTSQPGPHDNTVSGGSFGAESGYALHVYSWILKEGWVNNYTDKNPNSIDSTSPSSMMSSKAWVESFSAQDYNGRFPPPNAYWTSVVDKLTTPAADGTETRKDRAEKFLLKSIRDVYDGGDYPRIGKASGSSSECPNASGLGNAAEYKAWVQSWVNWLNNAPKGTPNHVYSV